jgi:2-polyprenyl-3-methyl-5-hydroxy-6-metoxy-1,4-benzoquinol methylase
LQTPSGSILQSAATLQTSAVRVEGGPAFAESLPQATNQHRIPPAIMTPPQIFETTADIMNILEATGVPKRQRARISSFAALSRGTMAQTAPLSPQIHGESSAPGHRVRCPPEDGRMPTAKELNEHARRAWNENATFWNDRMGEGNDFFQMLLWPAVERLLGASPGDRILDVACGNGVASRRLANAGASVVGIDFSARLIELAKSNDSRTPIEYRVIDATDHEALLGLGEGAFAGAVCNMALMDIADIEPLMRALSRILRPGGALVFTVLHPCFNNPAAVQMAEVEYLDEGAVTKYSVKVSRYLSPYEQLGLAMTGQPVPHPYFHRSLESLLAPALRAGLVLDALEERAFPPDHVGRNVPVCWDGRFSEIPPVLVARLRRPSLRIA